MTTPFTLALDCSLGGLHIAIQHSNTPTLQHSSTAPRAADTLHSTLQTLLESHNLALSNVTTFITTVGPGSFTGIRMGLAVGQALKLLNPNLTLIGLGTLEALASNLLTHYPTNPLSTFSIATDAAGQTLYHQTFAADGTPTSEPTCIPSNTLTLQHSNTPVYAPTTFMLPTAQTLPPFNPATLLTLAANPAAHKPFAPMYVKPLTYKTAV